jgi:hypothetical protein
MARVIKFRQILTENLLPSRGVPGHVYFCKAEQSVWIVLGDDGSGVGPLLDLSDIIANHPIRTVGPQGERGEKGDVGSVGPQGGRGETGVQGAAGIHGREGAQGQKGQKGDTGMTGQRGTVGERGERGTNGDTSALVAEMAELKQQLQAIIDMNRGAGQYLEWLRAKRVATHV